MQHGRMDWPWKEKIRDMNRMISRGNKPNHVTLVSLLMACSQARLADEGLEYFYSTNRTYGIEPSEEHYSRVIDMLGRAGTPKRSTMQWLVKTKRVG